VRLQLARAHRAHSRVPALRVAQVRGQAGLLLPVTIPKQRGASAVFVVTVESTLAASASAAAASAAAAAASAAAAVAMQALHTCSKC
jgi:hypothetical protein